MTIDIEDVQRITVQPDEVLVIRVPAQTLRGVADDIRNVFLSEGIRNIVICSDEPIEMVAVKEETS